MKKFLIVLAFVVSFSVCGCTGSNMAQLNAYGKAHHIKQFSGMGTVIGEWDSTGKVQTEPQSDGWYFKDAATGKIVEVSGTIQITIKE